MNNNINFKNAHSVKVDCSSEQEELTTFLALKEEFFVCQLTFDRNYYNLIKDLGGIERYDDESLLINSNDDIALLNRIHESKQLNLLIFNIKVKLHNMEMKYYTYRSIPTSPDNYLERYQDSVAVEEKKNLLKKKQQRLADFEFCKHAVDICCCGGEEKKIAERAFFSRFPDENYIDLDDDNYEDLGYE